MRPSVVVLVALCLTLPAIAKDLSEDLWAAARKGDADALKALLAKGADVNAKTPYGATALSFAADKGHLAVVKLLLAQKADVNVKDTFYQATPLTWAQMRGHDAVVRELVAAGATGAEAALVAAARAGKLALVRSLVETGKLAEPALSKALAATPATAKELAELLKKAGAKAAPKGGGPKVALDAATLAAYAGLYRSDSGSELFVKAEGTKLSLSFDQKKYYALVPVTRTSFELEAFPDVKVSFPKEGKRAAELVLGSGKTQTTYRRAEPTAKQAEPPPVEDRPVKVAAAKEWPSFRGPGASGVADGQHPPTAWDAVKGHNLLWKTPILGLGHSCPVVWGERVFLTTAISGDPKAAIRPGLYGDVDSVADTTPHSFRVYALDRRTGKVLWERIAHQGVPKIKRHTKGSHANPTPATDGRHLIVSFASEGLYCYDLEGRLLWKRDLGTLDSGWFYDRGYEWGFASSPVLYEGLVLLQCDLSKDSFLAAFSVEDGKEVWRTPRAEPPSWGTPTIVPGPNGAELVTSATKYARGYDPLTGKELWRLGPHAEITVPTPVFGQGLIFLTSGYRPVQPIYAVRPGARGDLSLKAGQKASDAVAWSTTKGGPYLPTPLVYGDHLYTCSNNSLVTCYEARTGKQVYKERLGGHGGYTASPVAADGRLYFTSEEAGVRVVQAGPKFRLLAVNPLGEACLATPAIADGMIYVRGEHHLFGIGYKGENKVPPAKGK
jgi:outer membrane protein assembly factor BamB